MPVDTTFKLLLEQVKKIHSEGNFVFQTTWFPKDGVFQVCMIRGPADSIRDGFYLFGEGLSCEEAVARLVLAFLKMIDTKRAKLNEDLRRMSELHTSMTATFDQMKGAFSHEGFVQADQAFRP